MRRLIAGSALAAAILVWWAAPALAHTSLEESRPENRSILAEAPKVLRLRFSNPVDPKSATIQVLGTDGRRRGTSARLTPQGPPNRVVEFSLPRLGEGTYGITWQSLGPDGHRVAGEVVFAVGSASASDLAGAEFHPLSSVDRVLDILAATARF
ncbi:MAG: copper resistance CopC family protein, partial [Candidatus Methylomirabilales bacterium]